MRRLAVLLVISGTIGSICAEIKPPKPGVNFFSPQQDVQLGKEAKAQVESQMPVIHDNNINGYLSQIGKKLAASPHAGDWPFSFEGIYDKNINAFALPGGPMFVNTATITAADNEAQLAGVMAHEMSHVVLRHGTHQMTKQQFVQLPALLAGNDPIEMARIREKLESKGSEGQLAQFVSDHPTPGNRVRSVEQEIQQLPQKDYKEDITGQLASVKNAVQHLTPPPVKKQPNPQQ